MKLNCTWRWLGNCVTWLEVGKCHWWFQSRVSNRKCVEWQHAGLRGSGQTSAEWFVHQYASQKSHDWWVSRLKHGKHELIQLHILPRGILAAHGKHPAEMRLSDSQWLVLGYNYTTITSQQCGSITNMEEVSRSENLIFSWFSTGLTQNVTSRRHDKRSVCIHISIQNRTVFMSQSLSGSARSRMYPL